MSVRVIARIRPVNPKTELEKDHIVSAERDQDGKAGIVRIPNPKNESEYFSFQFSNVYDDTTSQQNLFDGEVAPTVKHLFNGLDVTIFAHGTTGSGKTHTMRGGKTLAERGVIPRMLSSIYRRARKIEKDSKEETQIQVVMSYYEIYCDKVFDLFEAPEKRNATGLPLRDNGGKTVVVGLSERPCENLKDFEKLYDQANMNRSTGATQLNAHSSRSHAVLCVKIIQTSGDQQKVSTASAIDLAGSEDNRRTGNNKERLVESSSINKSLFVLAQCVEAISKKASRIPYRESRMTRILSLGQNNGITIMILALAPIRSFHLDTLSSLNFANRTKKIEVREIENEPIFKGCSRPVAVGSGLQRQPLRALTSATHNVNVNKPADDPAKAVIKPKTFSVFSDKGPSRSSLTDQSKIRTHRNSPLKRTSDSHREPGRPAKIARPNPTLSGRPAGQTMSKAAIEGIFSDMVEKKVGEILAARAMDQQVQAPPDISDEVKKRLEMLEQRIENQDDTRTEGLNYLLMAKQHTARGEESSALRMYELAKGYFPDNAKLEAKIEKLRQRLQERHGEETNDALPMPRSLATAPIHPNHHQIPSKLGDQIEDGDDEYVDQGAMSEDDDVSSKRRSKVKAKRGLLTVVSDNAPQTPRTRQLLSIINSQDLPQIRLLRGVGAKKAEAIIDAMRTGTENEADYQLKSVSDLYELKGISQRAVQAMRDGLGTGEVDDF